MNEYFSFQLHILDDCDVGCKQCTIFSNGKNTLHQMSFETLEIVLDKCLEFCEKFDKIPYFAITGCDPILHPNFFEFLELLSGNNLNYIIMGNPHYLTEDICNSLKDLNCRQYQMSLDGLRKTHDYLKHSGSYDMTFKKIKLLQKANIKTSIMTTVLKDNFRQIPWLIDEIVRAKVDFYSFARYCPSKVDDTILTHLEYKNFLTKIWDKFIEYKDFNTLFSLKDNLWTLFLYEKGLFNIRDIKKNIIYDGCCFRHNHLYVLPNSDVLTCSRMDSKIGNLFSNDLVDIFY